jgi:four helix bundle protein
MMTARSPSVSSSMPDHATLTVWRRARSLAVSVNEVARALPPGLAAGFPAQLVHATMSIGGSVAEGAARESRADFAHLITIAASLATEAERHLALAFELGVIDASIAARLVDRVVQLRRMLDALHRALLAAEARSPDDPTSGAREPRSTLAHYAAGSSGGGLRSRPAGPASTRPVPASPAPDLRLSHPRPSDRP